MYRVSAFIETDYNQAIGGCTNETVFPEQNMADTCHTGCTTLIMQPPPFLGGEATVL